MLKSKKAISPILATLLLIVIAVAAIVVTYAWIMTYMSSAGEQAGVTLFPENTFWNATEKKTHITIHNTGTSDTKLVTLYMGTTKDNLVDVTASTSIGTTGITLRAKTTATITLNWPNSVADAWTPGNSYYFNVVAEGGQQTEPYPEQAPQ
jgi:flagellin-like protein